MKAMLVHVFRAAVIVALVNGVFYAFYRIAYVRFRLSAVQFTIGCALLLFLVIGIVEARRGK